MVMKRAVLLTVLQPTHPDWRHLRDENITSPLEGRRQGGLAG